MHSFRNFATVILIFWLQEACCRFGTSSEPSAPYIIGGYDAPIGKYPFMASYQEYTAHMCGAAIISSRWLVTAAHCEDDIHRTSILVGTNDKAWFLQPGLPEGEPTRYEIEEVIMHPDYVPDGSRFYPNDVALIKTTEEIAFNKFVQPVVLPESDETFSNATECVTMGWGVSGFRKTSRGRISMNKNILQELPVSILKEQDCSYYLLDETQGRLCLMSAPDAAICIGDSGSPAVCRRHVDSEWVLVGGTSIGFGLCDTEFPSVDFSASAAREWIKEITGI